MLNSPHRDEPIVNEPEAIARRRLSPIALELLEALEFFVNRQGGDLPAYMNPAIRRAQGAITKALAP